EISQVPMDYADADVQGAVGYMFQRALHNEFTKRRIDRAPITVVTQVLVDKKDPAFENPTKPIGPQLNEEIAKQRATEHGWIVKEDAGRGWRRVVPSPKPKKIIELEQIRHLVDANYVVIACGGGGIPVIENEKNYLVGVEAVIDKDLASGMLASSLGVDLFIISTDVDKVAINFRKKNQQWLDCMTLSDARAFHAAGQFDEGSMGPKIQAMSQYLEHGGRRGLITNPEKLELALQGKSGTAFGG
ncbi:MAG TPA: carbamate kinase, partial [Rhodospirillales bacterium]|nr:carbamate kinase [Rhodospirillales bacterium]